ncbi:MAG: nucleotidyltransferase domain-containing protein [Candidatus Binataceae bacterium]
MTDKVARIRGIGAVVLGGSHARGTADRHSDIDLGLYYDSRRPFQVGELRRVARELDDRPFPASVTDFGAWGPGVNGGGWLIVGGRHLDFLYREIQAVGTAIEECRRGEPKSVYQLGHPLGFHNQIYAGEVACCRPLFDPKGAVAGLKKLVGRYPVEFRRAVVKKHLYDAAFEIGIVDKPAARGDIFSTSGYLFRAAGFMILVLYGVNRRWFINEKGAIRASRGFLLRPRNFHATIQSVLAAPGRSPRSLVQSVTRMKSAWVGLATLAARSGLSIE